MQRFEQSTMMPTSRLKVFIAEDEPRILALIKSFINWDELHLQFDDDAENGDEAIRKISESKPDIIITDIRMPGTNGLSVAEWVSNHLPQSQVIIISGYKQFNYAYDALKLSVSDFLIKPINQEELNRALAKIVNRHFVSITSTIQKQVRDTELKKTKMNLRRQCLLSMIFNPHMHIPDDIESFNENNALHFGQGYYFGAVISVFNNDISFAEYCNEKKNTFNKAENVHIIAIIIQKLRDIILEELQNVCIDVEAVIDNYNLNIIGNIQVKQVVVLRRNCISAYHVMRENCGMFPNIDIVMGISRMQTDHRFLPECLVQAWQAIPCKCTNGVSAPLFMDDYENSKMKPTASTLDSEIQHACEKKDVSMVAKALNRYFLSIRESIICTPLLLGDVIEYLVYLTLNIANRMLGINDAFELAGPMREYFYLNGYDIKSYEYTITATIEELFTDWFAKLNSGDSLPIRRVKQYINDNFAKQITIDELAISVNLSASHLSAVFKRETKTTIIDFLTQVRIDQAKKMLTTTTMSVAEIAYAVGYQDAKYFSRAFFRTTRIRPSEYRQLNQRCEML